jgi:phosphoserine aminotransferase
LSSLNSALLSRSHRSSDGLAKIQRLLKLTRAVLEIPEDYAIALVPGSGTGAIESALWNFLGSRPVDVFSWDVFGKLWAIDVVEQLPINPVNPVRSFTAEFGDLPDLDRYDGNHDCVFTVNGTTSGVMVPHFDWIPPDRLGLTLCDATSSAFIIPVQDWSKLDVTCFSWQKGLGGEAGHGMMVVSPRALRHLETFHPPWPIPRLFKLTREGRLIPGLFNEGKTINTPSLLCLEDAIQGLEWAARLGGQQALWERVQRNFEVMDTWITTHAVLDHLAKDPVSRSRASICFKLTNTYCGDRDCLALTSQIVEKLASLGVAYDIKNHAAAPASFRVWCGPAIETEDLKKLTQWIDWALGEIRAVA